MSGTPPADTPSFGDLLRRHRIAAGLTQESLAERAGVSARGISDLERGIRAYPQRETARRLVDALDLGPAERAALVGAARRAPASGERHARQPPLPVAARLPAFAGVFVGRVAELATIRALLERGDTPLLTISGSGGTGKTRLAVATASAAADQFPGGIVFVDLSAVNDPELVMPQIAASLDVRAVTREPLADLLARRLAGRRLLLILDNCEQVVGAAPAIAALLGTCPALAVLATSREPLRLRAEQVVSLPPLPVPEAGDRCRDTIAATPSVELFVARARARDHTFHLTDQNAPIIASICQRLDGLPLAIELAAAAVTFLSPQALLAHLERRLFVVASGARDLPARQQSLRATIAWSYDLLEDAQQRLFRSLAVFVGGWTLEAAHAVAGDVSESGLLAILAALVDTHFVQMTPSGDHEPRYSMLETIREFAGELLAGDPDEDQVRRAHLRAMLQLGRENDLEVRDPAFEIRLARLAADEANLRAALAWGGTHHPEHALELIGYLRHYWFIQGRLALGLELHERVLATGVGQERAEGARALYQASWLAINLGDLPRAQRYADASFAQAERLGLERAAAYARHCQADIAQTRGEAARAQMLLDEAVARFQRVGDVWGQSACLTSLGVLALNRGDAAAAVQCFARVHAIHVEHRGIVREHATTLGNLAEAYRHLGEYDAARGFANQARALAETVESDYDVARSGAVLGRLALGDGDIARAASLIKESLGALWEIGDRWSLVQTLETAAAILGACGQGRKASRLFGAADTLREAMATPIGECDRAEREHDLGHIRLTLEASAFATAWSDGARLALHEAIAEAEAALDGLAGAGP